MTPRDEEHREEKDSRLHAILRTVRSIDSKVDDVLEKLEDCLEDGEEPIWPEDYNQYLDEFFGKYGQY